MASKNRNSKGRGNGGYDRTNTGILNAIKRKNPETGKEEMTDLVRGKLNVAGTDYQINGAKTVDSKKRPIIEFSITRVSEDDAFSDVQVVSEDGVLKLNTNRASEKAPVYRGDFTINGSAYRVSGWVKEHAEYGKFISLSVQTEEEYQRIVSERRGASEESDDKAEVSEDQVDV